MHSDINTDNDDKAYRKVRARKAIDTDDNESDYNDHETCLPPYPKQPPVHGSKYENCFLLNVSSYSYACLR